MKFLMYQTDTSSLPRVGILLSDGNTSTIIDLTSTVKDFPHSLDEIILGHHLDEIQSIMKSKIITLRTIAPTKVKILPPFLRPGKILCVGLNYRDHVLEGGRELPKFPTIFTKASTALIGQGDTIVLPDCSQQVDFEAELAVVIGKKAFKVKKEEAMEYVAGYTILNDVTARDYQSRSSQWTVGKSFDTFAPMGPVFVTCDEIPKPHNLEIQSHLNGVEMQHSNTRQLIFDIPFLIEDLSAVMTLEPGDILSTGTPSGVGVYREPPIFLQDGDVIEISVQNIGTLSNICKRITG